MKRFLILLFLVLVSCKRDTEQAVVQRKPEGKAVGVEYYVSPLGSNSNDGLGPDPGGPVHRPWRTIHYSISHLNPGDTLYCRAGIYRERTCYYGKDGTEANPITIRDYGDGDVNLYAERDGLAAWTNHINEIWTVDFPTESMTPKGSVIPCIGVHNIIVDDVPLKPKLTLAELVAGSFYYDLATKKIYAWCYEGGSPNGRSVGIVETFNSNYDAWMKGMHFYGGVLGPPWITVKNINIRYAPGVGIYMRGSYCTMDNITVKYCNKHGIMFGATGSTVKNSEVYFTVMHNWPRGRYNNGYGGWDGGLSCYGHYGTVQNCKIWMNHGEGLIASVTGADTTLHVVFRDNEVFDNFSENIYQNHGSYFTVERNLVYSNTPNYTDIWEYCTAPWEAKKRCLPMGIGTSDEEPPGTTANVIIRNNIIMGHRYGIHHYNHVTGYGVKNWHILNNTIIMPDRNDYYGDPCIGIKTGISEFVEDIQIRNNIIYSPYATGDLLYCTTDDTLELFHEMDCNRNCLYAPSNPTPIKWGSGYYERYSHADWLLLEGSQHGEGDVTINPGLVSLSDLTDVSKKAASGSSPIVDAGTTHAEVTEDYDEVARPIGAGPDMGAYEYGIPGPFSNPVLWGYLKP